MLLNVMQVLGTAQTWMVAVQFARPKGIEHAFRACLETVPILCHSLLALMYIYSWIHHEVRSNSP